MALTTHRLHLPVCLEWGFNLGSFFEVFIKSQKVPHFRPPPHRDRVVARTAPEQNTGAHSVGAIYPDMSAFYGGKVHLHPALELFTDTAGTAEHFDVAWVVRAARGALGRRVGGLGHSRA